jgi:hypothetical protein
LHGHDKDALGKPRDKKHAKVAKLMSNEQDLLEGEMQAEREAGRPMFATNDDEWAAAVVVKFWLAWGKRYPNAPPRRIDSKQLSVSGIMIRMI